MAKQSNALEVLRKEHREVQSLFQRFERASEKEQDKLCNQMVDMLNTHTRIEEEVFYPYLRESSGRKDLIEEAYVEHTAAKQLLKDLESNGDALHRRAVVKVLSEYVGHHIREEEEKIFPMVEKMGVDLEALGEELVEHQKGRARGEVMQGEPEEGEAGAKGGREGGQEGGQGGKASFAAQAHSREEDEAFVEAYGEDLSPSTQRAKWIHQPGEREDHPGQTLATRNPAVIREWAEARKARPATSPGGDPENPRVLRFDFPGYDKNLQPVSWDAWFRTFEERELVFMFQQRMKAGNQSNFFRLDNPHREDA